METQVKEANVFQGTKSKAMRRRKSRGAAMVEAVVVIPVLITCWGVIMFAGGARWKKIETQQTARENIFRFATNACQGSVAGGGAGPSIPDLGQGASNPNGAAGQGNSAASDLTSATQSFGTTSGSTSGNWAWGGGYVYANAPLSGHAFYFCNEKSYSGIGGFLSYAIDQVRSIVPNNLL
jgi:hypothetical protein